MLNEVEWERLIEDSKWSDRALAEFKKAKDEYPEDYYLFLQRKKGRGEDEFEPGSDMHVWATTRFF